MSRYPGRVKWLLALFLASPSLAAEPLAGLVERFYLPASPIEIRQAAKGGRFFDTMARRAGILGTEGQGFEAWVYPLKILHDCRLHAVIEGSDEVVDLGSRVDSVTVRPESVTLTATHSLFSIRQIFFTPLEQAGTVLLLDIDTARPLTLTVSFIPDLKPMWPAGLGGQYASWIEARRAFSISESRHKYNGLIGCPAALHGTATPAHELGNGRMSFDIRVAPETARGYFYPIVIAGGQNGRDDAYAAYDATLASIRKEYDRLVRHFSEIRERLLSIETPEPELNLGFEWAKVALDKGLVNNPDLGMGLVAGWGPSGDSARPGFGWFFGGDTFLNEFAISSIGDFATVRQAFRFLQQRQRSDGKMMHELTQSAAWLRWFEEYPYGYYHGDTTPFYITAFYDFYRRSGDTEFLKQAWGSLRRAYAYCKTTDEDGDGLMDNTRAGLGASELGSLLEGLRTDILLGALSPAAWRAMAALSDIMGDEQIHGEAQALWEKATKSANDRFWSPELNFFVHALTSSGGQNRELTAWPALGIMLGILQGERADRTAEMMASSALSTDWGTRILASTSKAYDPAAYNNGAVWPFLTGLISTAEFERHRAFSGYQLAVANARLTWAGALGYHPELLSGDYYRPLETAVPHQLFSSGGMLTCVVRGLLGLSGDAVQRVLRFNPHLPPAWKQVLVRRYRIGDDLFNLLFERSAGKWRCTIDGGSKGYRLEISPALGPLASAKSSHVAGAVLESAGWDQSQSNQEDSHYLIAAKTDGSDRVDVELDCDRGIELDAPVDAPQPGDRSRNLRILSVRNERNTVTAELEGLSGRSYAVRVWTALPIVAVRGGRLIQTEPKAVEVSFPPGDARLFSRATLQIDTKQDR
jgi:hypothetical protein